MVVGPLPARLCRLSFRLRRRGALQLCDPRRESRELRLSRGRGPRAAVRVNLLPQLPSSDRHCGPLRRRQRLQPNPDSPSIPLWRAEVAGQRRLRRLQLCEEPRVQTLVGGVARLAVGDATQSHLDAPHLFIPPTLSA